MIAKLKFRKSNLDVLYCNGEYDDVNDYVILIDFFHIEITFSDYKVEKAKFEPLNVNFGMFVVVNFVFQRVIKEHFFNQLVFSILKKLNQICKNSLSAPKSY